MTLSSNVKEKWQILKYSRGIILFLVIYTNMLDNLLLTAIVPILPEILLDLEVREAVIQVKKYKVENTTALINIINVDQKSNQTDDSFAKTLLRTSYGAIDENSKVGWILSSKALVQILVNPAVGYLSNRYGYTSLFTIGTCILLISVTVYTFSSSFVSLLSARIIQGFGSSFSSITGMSLLAEHYTDDRERSRAMGFAMGGVALGVLVGYPYGGFLYSRVGRAVPFLVLSVFVAFNVALQILLLHPSMRYKRKLMTETPMYNLLRDPYILVSVGAIMMTTMSMAILEPTVPIWIMDTMDAQKWQLGLVFLPDSIGYCIGTNCFGIVAQVIGRWLCSMVCMIVIGLCLILIPCATSVTELIVPHFGLGLGLGITDAALMPLLARLVDTRHTSLYGSVYAIAQLAVCLAYGIGPALGGQIVKLVGFRWLLWSLAAVIIILAPACFFLKDPPIQEENRPILEDVSIHELYLQESSDDGLRE